jgi:hypothetical protein
MLFAKYVGKVLLAPAKTIILAHPLIVDLNALSTPNAPECKLA